MTAMIVLFWSNATRDPLRSFGWDIAALHEKMQRRSCHSWPPTPIASIGPAWPGPRAPGHFFRTRTSSRSLASAAQGPKVCRLFAGGRRIRTFGTAARKPSEASRASRVEDLAFSSTARQRRIRLPVIRVSISSRCHRALGRDGRRNRRAVSDPELHHPAPKMSSPRSGVGRREIQTAC